MAQHPSWNRWFNACAIAPGTRSLVLASATLLVLLAPAQAQQKISASEAKEHIGETATVCSAVASSKYASSTKGQPTFLNLDKPYPNQVFTVLIWGENCRQVRETGEGFQGETDLCEGQNHGVQTSSWRDLKTPFAATPFKRFRPERAMESRPPTPLSESGVRGWEKENRTETAHTPDWL